MIVKKVTTGFVIQEFDTETRQFVSQEFVAGEQVDFEDEFGDTVEPFSEYLAFDMVPPQYMEQEDIPDVSVEVEDRRNG